MASERKRDAAGRGCAFAGIVLVSIVLVVPLYLIAFGMSPEESLLSKVLLILPVGLISIVVAWFCMKVVYNYLKQPPAPMSKRDREKRDRDSAGAVGALGLDQDDGNDGLG